MPDLLTATEVAETAGITYRQIDWWVSHGLLLPADGEANPGNGHSRRFTPEQAERAATIARLVRGGLRHAVAARLTDRLPADDLDHLITTLETAA